MRNVIASLALLVAWQAAAQGLTPLAPGQTGGGKVLWQAPFATPGCYADNTSAGASSNIRITRASTATYVDANGVVQTCNNGEFRVTSDGLLVEPGRTNYALQSNSISSSTNATSPWIKDVNTSGATIAGAAVSGTWAEITNTNSAFGWYAPVDTASASTFFGSVWAAAPSGTGAATVRLDCITGTADQCSCYRSDGGECSYSRVSSYCDYMSTATIGTAPVRLGGYLKCSGNVSQPYIVIYPGNRGSTTGTMRFSGAQVEVGTYPTSLIVTTGSSAARAADQVSATVPAVPGKWGAVASYTPAYGNAWKYGTLFSMGTVGGANSFRLIESGAGSLIAQIMDGSSGKKALLASHTFSAGSAQSVKLLDKSGTLSLSIAGTESGTGTGQFGTAPTTLYFGGLSGAPPNWAGNTAYTVGQVVTNGSNTYACIAAGTSAASGGPTGTTASITDGGVTWAYWPAQASMQIKNFKLYSASSLKDIK